MSDTKDPAVCRGCRMTLKEFDYSYGGAAYHPRTGKRVPVNHFGGFVCSESCDRRACLDMLSSMPGAGPTRTLDSPCAERVRQNWGAPR